MTYFEVPQTKGGGKKYTPPYPASFPSFLITEVFLWQLICILTDTLQLNSFFLVSRKSQLEKKSLKYEKSENVTRI